MERKDRIRFRERKAQARTGNQTQQYSHTPRLVQQPTILHAPTLKTLYHRMSWELYWESHDNQVEGSILNTRGFGLCSQIVRRRAFLPSCQTCGDSLVTPDGRTGDRANESQNPEKRNG